MKFLALFVLAAIAAMAAAVDVPYTLCSGSSIVDVSTITANVWPPTVGTPFAMTTTGTSSAAVAGGEFKVAVKFSGIDVDTQTGNLCDFGDISCPMAAGAVTIVNEGTLPDNAPAGEYSMRTKLTNAAGEQVLCYTIKFTL